MHDVFVMIERAVNNKKDDMVTLPFPPTATTSASPSGSVLRPHLGNTVSFWCPVPVGGHFSRISWTVQGRTVFERGQPVALPASQPHSHYEFAQLDDGTAVLSIRNVSLASSGEVVCRLEEAARTTVLRRFTLIPASRGPLRSSRKSCLGTRRWSSGTDSTLVAACGCHWRRRWRRMCDSTICGDTKVSCGMRPQRSPTRRICRRGGRRPLPTRLDPVYFATPPATLE
ncbi:uncharacterized protein LOC129593138 isoform X2 [Paramacrobiotus metropolitanus]|uniref:uncharacterized protein LOC129593138 isoform X2 n=1 Tax=Paramacrobiotus metropolitanus TaxID=2943436 RepID=UPI00244621C0|nr:uncharacterized protein LOC129593138 isoform X2 [Paramacrobiotus metropolitanus]